jgi:hypothetical protein
MDVSKLTLQLEKIKKEIEQFQKNCKHENQYIKFDKNNNARWYCRSCALELRIPTQTELEEWISR